MRTFIVIFCMFLSYNIYAEPKTDRVSEIRHEASALTLVQAVLDWYTRTVGEPSITAETYRGHERLFSKESIAAVGQAMRGARGDDQRALAFLKSYLAVEYLAQHIAVFDDEAENAQLTTTVKLSWLEKPVPYKQLD